MYKVLRSLLFGLNPEASHYLSLLLIRMLGLGPIRSLWQGLNVLPSKPVKAFGLEFKNPLGIAAGYDKNGIALKGLAALGFGHIEVGTVTPNPQEGNPKPRVFRLVEDEAVINRLGFPGKGADYVAMSLRAAQRRSKLPANGNMHGKRTGSPLGNDTIIGLNLGKNKDTPLEDAADDYLSLIRKFGPLADYLTINISSPNTVGLRRLQGRAMLENLLGSIAAERIRSNSSCPILVKLAPDLSDEELNEALGVILDTGMDGIIATNTTLARDGLRSVHREEAGGLSGRPLKAGSEAMLKKIVTRVDGHVPIVSVGGIMSPEDAKRRIDLGATLVQIYTGLIYNGPSLVRDIVTAL